MAFDISKKQKTRNFCAKQETLG